MENPLRLIVVAFVLLLAGMVLPFLMINQVIESTVLSNFIAYACSSAGLITGFIGIATYAKPRK